MKVCVIKPHYALDFSEYVKTTMPPVKNDERIFGNQYIMDETDQILGSEEILLTTASGISIDDAVKEFSGSGYGDFKLRVVEAVAEHLIPIQKKYDDLMKNKDYLESIYKNGAESSHRLAQRTLKKVYKKVGFIVD